ncbi:MAG: chromosome partitioning protein ParB [Candidatus Latescibacteria bacterium]|nr:chromosome partitioning protein ParB [Candidatus Latescibacterota bacterium]
MVREVETASIDLRYEGHRMRNRAQERKLLASIQERGIEEPLLGVDLEGVLVLLDGFKRHRCARRLGLGLVPFSSVAADEATGVVVLLRTSNRNSLNILEQARFVDDLCRVHGMSVADIAEALSHSASWVRMRMGLIGEMDAGVRKRILNGHFPAYAYMSTLRPYLRRDKEGVSSFVEAVSGQGLSVREIDDLAQGYFRGPSWFRQAIEKGPLTLALDRLREGEEETRACPPLERRLLKDLEGLMRTQGRIAAAIREMPPPTPAFRAQAHLILTQVLGGWGDLGRTLKELHDRSAET